MARMIIRHTVRDYAVWRPGFDAHDPIRRAAGLTQGEVFRKAEDPNDLVITLQVADLEKARAFCAADDLREVMQRLGVLGPPQIDFIA